MDNVFSFSFSLVFFFKFLGFYGLYVMIKRFDFWDIQCLKGINSCLVNHVTACIPKKQGIKMSICLFDSVCFPIAFTLAVHHNEQYVWFSKELSFVLEDPLKN